jgi:hypothetical protein
VFLDGRFSSPMVFSEAQAPPSFLKAIFRRKGLLLRVELPTGASPMSSSEGQRIECIPRDTAIRLCNEIRLTKERRLFSQCWGCVKFSKGVFDKMCAAGKPDNRGCALVNARYDRAGRQ